MFKPCSFACASSAYQDKLGGFGHDKFAPIGSGQVASLSNGSVVVNTVFKVVGTWNACNSAITSPATSVVKKVVLPEIPHVARRTQTVLSLPFHHLHGQ